MTGSKYTGTARTSQMYSNRGLPSTHGPSEQDSSRRDLARARRASPRPVPQDPRFRGRGPSHRRRAHSVAPRRHPRWPPRHAAPAVVAVGAAPEKGRTSLSSAAQLGDGHRFRRLGALGTVRDVLVVGAASFLLWMLISFQIWSTMRAFDLVFPFPVAFFVLTWAILGLAIPTPGGVGGYHAAVAYSLFGFYGVSKNTAAAFALVSHALSFVPITLIGLVL